ncbi:MAG: hypothetical protein M3162_01220 [Thermoproteota archaeon]|nr:hypothetical protein [Thermoproteota archaeon]
MSKSSSIMMTALVLLYSTFLLSCTTIVNIDAKPYHQDGLDTNRAGLSYISSHDESLMTGAANVRDVDNTNTSISLSAIGTIDSLIITVPQNGFNITSAFKVVLTGGWSLSLKEGDVTYFDASFLATPMDGTRPHIHQLTNFKTGSQNNGEPNGIQLKRDENYNHNILAINGTVDIKINGETTWENVDSSISIKGDKVVAIYLDDEQTDLHFGNQQVFGLVRDIIYN